MRWFSTLKFQIIALAVATGVTSALLTAHWVLDDMRGEIRQRLLLDAADESQTLATLLSSKLDTLNLVLKSVTAQAGATAWADPAAMAGLLQSSPAAAALFDGLLAIRTNGDLLARTGKDGVLPRGPVNVADRPYFQRALKSDQIVVSEPVVGRITQVPQVVMALRASGADGKPLGVLAGTLALGSDRLFMSLGAATHDGTRRLIMDRDGVMVGHVDPRRVLQHAQTEPGLAQAYQRWKARGRPIESEATAQFSAGYLVAQVGIPFTDWTLVSLAPQAVEERPLRMAQRTAWGAAAGVGCIAALLAGLAAFFLTRPISRLHVHAKKLLAQEEPGAEPWPVRGGELGSLARVFAKVVAQRQQRQQETRALLLQLEAVLDHADVGIALTRQGSFVMVSQQFCAIFRCDKQIAQGKPTRILYASDEAHETLSGEARRAFARGEPFECEAELVRFNGESFWALVRGRAVSTDDPTRSIIWTIADITQAREKREQLSWNASHDSLTRLCNRSAFEATLESAVSTAASAPFCAMFIDLDRFKFVNDDGGHAAGDALLRGIAAQFAAQVRRSDLVARLGGDEFAVFLHRCPLSQAREIAEQVRKAVVAYRLPWEGKLYSVGASIGLVQVDGSFDSCAEILRAADAACYRAKQQGRDRVVVHGEAQPS